MLLGQRTDASPAKRKRIEAVVETLASLHRESESLAGLAHDARNMVTALALYCDLLEEPGVLGTAYRHYGGELRLLAAASRRLVEKILALDTKLDAERSAQPGSQRGSAAEALSVLSHRLSREAARNGGSATSISQAAQRQNWEALPVAPINNLARELTANRNLLAALAGPAIALTVETAGGAEAVRLSSEDLTRLLVNLVKNATEAISGAGAVRIHLAERPATAAGNFPLLLSIEDSGPGIPAEAREWVFESGYTTRAKGVASPGGKSAAHRGLGLAITRSIVEAAGGRIQATEGVAGGARIEIELPVHNR
jgi:signal transduction histidine kinase